MQEYFELPPLAIASGQGGWLTDTEGRTYLDGNASIWTNVHGHNDPDLNAALAGQLARMAHSTMLGLTHPAGAELQELDQMKFSFPWTVPDIWSTLLRIVAGIKYTQQVRLH